jgi:protoporphyrinogen oxidase
MNKSENIGKLAEALSKVQAEIKGAVMDSENPYFKSKYADLTSVWEACRKPLTENGLSIVQTGVCIADHPERVAIETTLIHSSGEWLSGIVTAKPAKDDPQSIGSCITYIRRYSLAAAVGICPEDDDGNDATGKGEPVKNNAQASKELIDEVFTPTPDQMKKEMSDWFTERFGEKALVEWQKFTNGKIDNPLTMKNEGNIKKAYTKYLSLRSEQNA